MTEQTTHRQTQHAIAKQIVTLVGSTQIDATRGPQHAAMRGAEISAQADLIVELAAINGWNMTGLFAQTAIAIARAKGADTVEQALGTAMRHDAAEDSHA